MLVALCRWSILTISPTNHELSTPHLIIDDTMTQVWVSRWRGFHCFIDQTMWNWTILFGIEQHGWGKPCGIEQDHAELMRLVARLADHVNATLVITTSRTHVASNFVFCISFPSRWIARCCCLWLQPPLNARDFPRLASVGLDLDLVTRIENKAL